jgi:hypothetical protein
MVTQRQVRRRPEDVAVALRLPTPARGAVPARGDGPPVLAVDDAHLGVSIARAPGWREGFDVLEEDLAGAGGFIARVPGDSGSVFEGDRGG